MSEHWKPVVGWEGLYEVSDHGRVRSLDRVDRFGRSKPGVMLRPDANRTGHLRVHLYGPEGVSRPGVHRIVLEAFVGPCPEGMEGCHNDGNPGNNRVGNLRWDTRSANHFDKMRHGWRSYNLDKTECPRGHRLERPNLVRSEDALGHRSCLACARARAHAHYRGLELDKQVADEYYAEIVGVAS